MKAKRIVLWLCLLCGGRAFGQGQPACLPLSTGWQLQDITKVPETGAVLSQNDYRPADWHKATVPGTVLTSLVNDGIYPEPLYGENNRPDTIPDSLCRTSYWYRTTFTVPRSYAGRHIWLNFAGINYAAEVWVNGHDMGSIKGAFARGLFDVTSHAVPGKLSTLAVVVQPQPHPGVPTEQTIANGVGLNGGISAVDGPTFLCTLGWDWIPAIRDRDTGIWQGVFLSAAGPVTVKDTYVTSTLPLPRTDTADLVVQTTLKNVTGKVQQGILVGTFGTHSFRYPIAVNANDTKALRLTPADIPALHVSHPRLWWPNGYGPQNLYALHLRFVQNNADSDAQDVTFGIRQLSYSLPGSDNLAFSVNGVPILCKGGDWGIDEAMKRIPAARLDAEVRMHQQAHCTMIRNWVGQSTNEDFYNACDKYGILVWDEFFQPNPSDGPNPDDVGLYLANAREKILRFRSHPSIALWCGRNEGLPPPSINDGISQLLSELESNRLYQPSSTSGRGVHSGGPYYWRTPREYYKVDAPFKTEIGSVSIPTREAVEAMMPAKDWNVINDDWAEHDLARGAQRGDRYPQIMALRYGPIASLADFTRKGQLMNYEAFRAMYEGREAQMFHPVTGVLTWMSNPAQPSFVWQLYSWDLEPNSALFATQKACEPIHIQMNQTDWHVMVINNTPQKLAGIAAKVSVYNLDGSLKYTRTDRLTAAASAATDDGAVPFSQNLSDVHFVKLELRDAQHRLLSDNFYWHETQQDDFQALNTLPMVPLTAKVTRRDVGGKCFLRVSLRNMSRSPALMAHLQLRNSRTDQRVLPVFYSDNYVSLLPGESNTITVEAALADLHGKAPLLRVDGWNVTVKAAAGIAPNTMAIVAPIPVPSAPKAPHSDTFRIDSGGSGGSGTFFAFGAAADPTPIRDFVGDTDVSGGSSLSVKNSIDTHVPNAAPQFIYQSGRYGEFRYTIPVPAGRSYTVRLHFAETSFDRAGARLFNVAVNGKPLLTNFDIFAAAGSKNKAVVKDLSGIFPDANGNIAIVFTKGLADSPEVQGLEVLPSSAQ